jgi:hypothetical protein
MVFTCSFLTKWSELTMDCTQNAKTWLSKYNCTTKVQSKTSRREEMVYDYKPNSLD